MSGQHRGYRHRSSSVTSAEQGAAPAQEAERQPEQTRPSHFHSALLSA